MKLPLNTVSRFERVKLFLMSFWPFFGLRSFKYEDVCHDDYSTEITTVKGWERHGTVYITSIKFHS